jgi:hypothetical protein
MCLQLVDVSKSREGRLRWMGNEQSEKKKLEKFTTEIIFPISSLSGTSRFHFLLFFLCSLLLYVVAVARATLEKKRKKLGEK